MLQSDVVICECFARDGLQHEPEFMPTVSKLEAISAFVDAGFQRVEATSYSHPVRVAGFSDASEVLKGLPRRRGVSFKATCPNEKALERAINDKAKGYGADELSLLVSATESHSMKNLRADRETQWGRVQRMVELADCQFELVGVLSVALGCPFEGQVDVDSILADYERFAKFGAKLVTVGDTIGAGDPVAVKRLFGRIIEEFPEVPPVAHFHNSRGTALANAVAAMDVGCVYFDSAMGGVGGHPATIHYGGGVTGNAATEDLVELFEKMGVNTGIDLPRLQVASRLCENLLERPLLSMVAQNEYHGDMK